MSYLGLHGTYRRIQTGINPPSPHVAADSGGGRGTNLVIYNIPDIFKGSNRRTEWSAGKVGGREAQLKEPVSARNGKSD